MLAELEEDLAAETLYRSPHLNDEGQRTYESLLRSAITGGTDVSFADALCANNALRLPVKWQRAADVGSREALDALASTLAEREFHRFYIRGLCRRAIKQGVQTLIIYRAKPPTVSRPPSKSMVGVQVMAGSLLEDLSGAFRSTPPHGLPQCHDPGLSVRLP
jgi:hypothetical protein